MWGKTRRGKKPRKEAERGTRRSHPFHKRFYITFYRSVSPSTSHAVKQRGGKGGRGRGRGRGETDLEAEEGDDKVYQREADAGKAVGISPFVRKDDENGAAVVHQHIQLSRLPRFALSCAAVRLHRLRSFPFVPLL